MKIGQLKYFISKTKLLIKIFFFFAALKHLKYSNPQIVALISDKTGRVSFSSKGLFRLNIMR